MQEKNTIEILPENKCSGCGACYNICPKDAIKMVFNNEGFLHPKIDKDSCILCGICEQTCPNLHTNKSNYQSPKSYAVKTSAEIMGKSTSAGVYSVLADYVIENNGYVCGATYNQNFEVQHILTNKATTAEKIRKSKYVQSNTGLIYRDIKSLLENDNLVLFSGCPCQVAGLKAYLKKSYSNLITVDIICHGTPSPISWKKYLNENIDISQLKNIDFRHKGNHGFKKHFICFDYKDGTQVIQPSDANLYYLHFTKSLGLRKSCFNCEYATFPRIGDISVGDWWGASKINPELIQSDSGLSVLMINNEHGAEVFENIKDKFQLLLKEISSSEAMTLNRASVKRKLNPNRSKFFNLLPYESFNNSVKKSLGLHYDVMLCGATVNTNYGGLITYYALYKAVERLGYSIVMCNAPDRKNASNIEINNHASKFCEKYFNLSEKKPLHRYSEFNKMADTFLLGSDQIWNYKLFNGRKENFYFDFVDDSKKKIAYAASFGFNKLTLSANYPEKYPKVNALLKRFDAISIRETDGVELCEDSFNVNADFVMDPVFLLNAADYSELSKHSEHKPEPHYLTTYFLTPNDENNNAIKFIAKKLNLPMVNMTTGNPTRFDDYKKKFVEPVCENLQIEEWLYNIQNSDIVITDSYHCLCFSIIFRKKFILIQEKWAPSRIVSLLSKLNLTDRWVTSPQQIYDNDDLINGEIDYDNVYKILQKEIYRSSIWLENALSSKKSVDIINQQSLISENYNNDLKSATSLKQFFDKFKNKKDDYILMMLIHGNKNKNTDRLTFFPSADIGPVSKNKMKTGFSYIYDGKSNVIKKNFTSFSRVVYYYDNLKFSIASQNQNYYGNEPISEFYIEKGGHRTIYSCEQEGFYALVYSKSRNKIIDIIYINLEDDKLQIIHK